MKLFGSKTRLTTAAGLALLCAVLAAAATASTLRSHAAKKPIKLGVVLPLTGSTGSVGVDALTGFQLALQLQNAGGGVLGHRITYNTQDTGSDPATAAALEEKFGGDKSYSAIVGPITAAETVAVAPVAKRYKIISYNTTGSGVLPDGTFNGWVFRINQSQALATAPTMRAVIKAVGNVKNIAILNYSDNAAYIGARDIWRKTASTLNLSVDNEEFPTTTQDYSPIISKLQGKNLDLIFIGALPVTLGPLIRQLRAAGIRAPIAGDASLFDPQTFSVSQGAAAGSYSYSSWLPTFNSRKNREFIAAYKKQFGRNPSAFAAYSYDLANILMDAIKRTGGSSDRVKLRNALAATKNFPGVSGKVNYGPQGGDAVRKTVSLVRLSPTGALTLVGLIPITQ
jgi:branched-chain amino acid transport system substrate-binding protein